MSLQKALPTFVIDPASLRHRIELKRQLFDADKPWKEASTTQRIATLWAAILSRSGSEEERADQLHPAEQLQFVIRHRSDLANPTSSGIILHHAGKVYELTAASDPDQRGHWLLLDAKRKVGS